MNDFKSKLPNLKEMGDIASKLFNDLKTSVSEIITEYKKNHPDAPEEDQGQSETVKPKKATAKTKAKEEKPSDESQDN